MENASPPATRVSSLTTSLRLLQRFRPAWKLASTVFGLQLIQTALELAHPILVAAILGVLTGLGGTGRGLPDEFLMLIWILAMVLAAKTFVFYMVQVSSAKLGQDLENTLRSDLYRHVTNLRFRYHDENRSGKTIANALRDMEQTKHFFREVWFGYLTVALLLVATVGAAFYTRWGYGLIVFGCFGTAVGIVTRVGARCAVLDREVCDDYDEVTTALQENVAGARVVRAFGREDAESNKYGGRMKAFTGNWSGMAGYWTQRMPWVGLLYNLGLPLVILVAVIRIHNGLAASPDGQTLSILGATTVNHGFEEAARVLLFCRKVGHRIRPLTRWVIMGQKAAASAARVFEILDRQELIRVPANAKQLPATRGELRLENVHFRHRKDTPVLQGVSLHVPAGSSLGILGPTGAGKSSLVQLLPRFYDPDQGRILLDGIELSELRIEDLRSAVGLVFQESFLFSGTVAENVAYGNPGVSRERIEECVRLAAAEDFVKALPKGYETIVGERGVSLSGGQRQRLTIARALAMSPRVLIFDDATASVDAVTEKALFDGIRTAAQGRTTLVISQRVTSVNWCDRIAVLDGGVITAVGTHAELVGSSELYREIHSYQQLTGAAS